MLCGLVNLFGCWEFARLFIRALSTRFLNFGLHKSVLSAVSFISQPTLFTPTLLPEPWFARSASGLYMIYCHIKRGFLLLSCSQISTPSPLNLFSDYWLKLSPPTSWFKRIRLFSYTTFRDQLAKSLHNVVPDPPVSGTQLRMVTSRAISLHGL